ncbi:hypothetical protein [Streptomyces sp. ISL-1]|uniref:hypothetical protein n=1 Tax=Streptomyces sp. ISL-1 TaxID=2817657 RepID=UPI002034ECC4|nr:hypothetical protein [Streptomyces sp. ISL-1]
MDHGEGATVRQIGEMAALSRTGSVAYELGRLGEQRPVLRRGRCWGSVRLGS